MQGLLIEDKETNQVELSADFTFKSAEKNSTLLVSGSSLNSSWSEMSFDPLLSMSSYFHKVRQLTHQKYDMKYIFLTRQN